MRRSRVAQAESVEDMRRRAQHRLIGAAILVAIGVIGFPMLFDTQPRPIPVDVPIEIPDRNEVAPLMVPGEHALSELPARLAPAEAEPVGTALYEGEEEVLEEPAPTAVAVPKPPQPPRLAPEPVAQLPAPEPAKSAATQSAPQSSPPSAPVSEAERVRALLEGRTPAPAAAASTAQAVAASSTRFIVQVGAFADASKAAEVRSKLERVGIKTYVQMVDTKDGKRTRVRVGPFDSRAEADQTATRIKGMNLAASVLTL